jgi:uncharacterized repeat protein (TIGR01451 family)
MKFFVSVILIIFLSQAAAQTQDHLDVRTTVQKEEVVVNDAGESEKRLVPAEVVVPGESVFYTITFTNVSAEPADNVVITNPIAEDLMYIDGSAFGPGMDILFSVDGGVTFLGHAERSRSRSAGHRTLRSSFGIGPAVSYRKLALGQNGPQVPFSWLMLPARWIAGICKW